MEVDSSLPGARVTRVLDQLLERLGRPELVVVDNGPEFAGHVMDAWAYRRGITLRFIDPGKPIQNAYLDSTTETSDQRIGSQAHARLAYRFPVAIE
jgi:putative transposase